MNASASIAAHNIDLYFYFCAEIGSGGVPRALELVKIIGGHFVDEVTREEIDDPMTHVTRFPGGERHGVETGGLGPRIPFVHPLLPYETSLRYHEGPILRLLNEVDAFCIHCYVEPLSAQKVEQMALGLLEVGKQLYPMLKPTYGDIDGWIEVTEEEMLDSHVEQRKLPYLMWANFFGPEYIQKYGKEFLMNAPGWLKEELPDGGVLYVVGPSLLDRWSVVSKQEVEAYFRRGVPGFKKAYEIRRPRMEFRFTILKLKGNRAVIPVDFTFWDNLTEGEKQAAQKGLLNTLASCLKRYAAVKVEFREAIPWEVERRLEHARQSELGHKLTWEVIRRNSSL